MNRAETARFGLLLFLLFLRARKGVLHGGDCESLAHRGRAGLELAGAGVEGSRVNVGRPNELSEKRASLFPVDRGGADSDELLDGGLEHAE